MGSLRVGFVSVGDASSHTGVIKAPLTDSTGLGRELRIRQKIACRVPEGQKVNQK